MRKLLSVMSAIFAVLHALAGIADEPVRSWDLALARDEVMTELVSNGRDIYAAVIMKKNVDVTQAAPGYFVVLNGRRIGPLEHHPKLDFSPDGSSIVHDARMGGKTYWAVNGRTIGPIGEHNDGHFTADSTFVYKTRLDGKWFVGIGDRKIGPCDRVWGLDLTPDGKDPVFMSFDNEGLFLNVGSRKTGPFPLEHISGGEGIPCGFAAGADGNDGFIYGKIENGKWYLVRGGRKTGPYDAAPRFLSLPGETIEGRMRTVCGWTALIGGRQYLFTGNEKLGPYDELGSPIALGPRCEPLLYQAKIGDAWYLFRGKEKLGPFGDIDYQRVTNDRIIISWRDFRTEKKFARIDDKIIGPFDGISNFHVSADGKALSYTTWIAGKSYMNWGNEKAGPFTDAMLIPLFVGDRVPVFNMREKGLWYIFTGHDKAGPYDTMPGVSLSPDGKTLAYAAIIRGRKYLIRGDRKEGPFDDVWWEHVFSRDSTRFAYGFKKGERWYIDINGTRSGPYQEIGICEFTQRDNRLIFTAREKGTWRAYIGGKKIGPSERLAGAGPNGDIFHSPDGKRVAIRGHTGPGVYGNVLYVDGAPVGTHNFISAIQFSPDGSILSYEALEADQSRRSVVVIGASPHPGSLSRDGRGNYLGCVYHDGRKVIVLPKK